MRERAGLTQKQVGEVMGVSQAAVAQWETGKTAPTVNKLRQLAKLYNCTVGDLLS